MSSLENKMNRVGGRRKGQFWIRLMGLRHLLFLRNKLEKKMVRFRNFVKCLLARMTVSFDVCIYPNIPVTLPVT